MSNTTKNDEDLRLDVLEELALDPVIKIASLNVSANQGKITLAGIARTYHSKIEAEQAIYRVWGVSAVENNLTVDPFPQDSISDEAIAVAIRNALSVDSSLPNNTISVRVVNGYVTLGGEVEWPSQREAAKEAAARIKGVKGINNYLTATRPAPDAKEIEYKIARAFARHAKLHDTNITVVVNEEGQVRLEGAVETGPERTLAEQIACKMPGVTGVTNNLTVWADEA
jgi:osmotically-inducible protein OsmY